MGIRTAGVVGASAARSDLIVARVRRATAIARALAEVSVGAVLKAFRTTGVVLASAVLGGAFEPVSGRTAVVAGADAFASCLVEAGADGAAAVVDTYAAIELDRARRDEPMSTRAAAIIRTAAGAIDASEAVRTDRAVLANADSALFENEALGTNLRQRRTAAAGQEQEQTPEDREPTGPLHIRSGSPTPAVGCGWD